MREFVLKGSYYEMGRQYGQYCRKEIKLFTKAIQIMTALSEHPGADFFSPKYRYLPSALLFFFKNRKRYRAQARESTDNIKRYYPEGFEMLRGMAEGARVHMDEATTLFSGNRNKRLEHFVDKYSGQFDPDAMHTIISDHSDPNDETHMRSMCMHPKHTNGAQTCASIIAMPRQKRFRIYETNPCLNNMKVYRF